MTEKLYDIDSHIREFEATVIDSLKDDKGYAAVLDRTAFFAEGGGQASDTGYINGIEVYDVQLVNGIIYHYTFAPVEKGVKAYCVLDFDRRFDFMQQHSAEHIVSGVAHKLYGCENVGFHLGEDIVTIDFDKWLTTEQICIIEAQANEAVFKNVKFSCYYPNDDELATLSYRSKKELEGAVRIVAIEDTDCCACCAPHVNTAGEIGLIKLLGGEKLRGGIRLELKAGRRALADYGQKHENVRKIASKLCVKQLETAAAVDRVLEQTSLLKAEISALKRQIIENKVKGFEPKAFITAIFEENLEIKELQHFADALYKAKGGIRCVLSSADNGFLFTFCGDAVALEEFFKGFKSAFTVKGGGRNGMVQGTVFAEKTQLESFFSDCR